MKTTLKDIARACGVSTGLVSRIVNKDDTLRCTQETRDRVLKEIERTGFTPDYHAKHLANHSIKDSKDVCIGYITYKGAEVKVNAYFDRIAEGVTTILESANYRIVRFYMDEVAKLYQKKAPLTDKKLDGLILFGDVSEGLMQYLSEQAKCISSVYGVVKEGVDFVGCDLMTSMNLMMDYVKEIGYKEIGVLFGTDKRRNEALKEYIGKIGLSVNEEYSFDAGYRARTAYEGVKKRLAERKPPKMICCMNDEMAIGVMNAVLEAGYRIPEDVSVTGHDDILKGHYYRVPLTTIRVRKEEVGRLVADLMLERINYKRKFAVKVFVPCELVVRKSTQKNKE